MWNAIQCNNKSIISAVMDYNCVTYDEDTGSTFVGPCFYNCINSIDTDQVYHNILPENPNELVNDSVCNWLNRKGLLYVW